ncbi:MAG: pentapeptide repeat-containing protein [Pseudomonadota bacterium]
MKRLLTVLVAGLGGAAAFLAAQNFPYSTEAWAGCDEQARPGVQWEDCRKRNLIMQGTDFSGANMARSDLSSSDLRQIKLGKADMQKANLTRASLMGAQAVDVNFTGVSGNRTDFSEGDFTNSVFLKAEISRANFKNSILSNVDLSKAELSRVNFNGADLSGVNFNYSSLARADLRNSKFDKPFSLKGAFLYRSRIEGLDLSNIEGLAEWQVEMACGDKDTKLPAGISRPQNWPCSAIY